MHACIEKLGSTIYWEIAKNFPIVSASDEFFYFPQLKSNCPDWSLWDRFVPEFIAEFAGKLSLWEKDFEVILQKDSLTQSSQYTRIRLLQKVVRTLREYLIWIRVWQTQPSFYLTITCLGLAQALEHGDFQAEQRARALPWFLDQAGSNLKGVPACFRDIGLDMIIDTRAYLIMLHKRLPSMAAALKALERFELRLKALPVHSEFRLPQDTLSRVIEQHFDSGMSLAQVEETLDDEIEAMNQILVKQARTMGHATWPQANAAMPLPKLGKDGLLGLYRDEVHRLGRHCRDLGLVADRMYQANPVRVMPVPGYLSAIRAASSYSISPGHPPSGGEFHVLNAHAPIEEQTDSIKEYRILAAHETWPGHHLLDINRWNISSVVLRAVEQPLFYEGWACFAEEMLAMTGYLSDPADRLLLAKRRLWRAIRGKVDLGLQTGTMSLDRAAALLTQTGMAHEQAKSSARKYLLSPGYQLCYTLGLRRFLALYQGWGEQDLAGFAQNVLTHGEICFEDLERVLQIARSRQLGKC
jgi:hypothetical protein